MYFTEKSGEAEVGFGKKNSGLGTVKQGEVLVGDTVRRRTEPQKWSREKQQ